MKHLNPMQDPELRPFLDDIRAWHGYVRFLGLPTLQDNPDTPIDNLFVPPQLAEFAVSPDTDPMSWPQGSDILAMIKKWKRLVILGDPGGGKTTLVNWLAWLLASGRTGVIPEWLNGVIPLPIVLRELDLPEVRDFKSLLGAFLKRPVAEKLRPKSELLHNLFQQGKVMVLVDGFDEVPQTLQKKVRGALSDGFARYKKSYFVVSSRIVGYEDCPLDWETQLRFKFSSIDRPNSPEAFDLAINAPINSFTHSKKQKLTLNRIKQTKGELLESKLLYVMPFYDQQIKDFAHNWYRLRTFRQVATNDADEFIKAVFSNTTTSRLARTPQLLTLMALVFRVRAQLPNGRALLYDLISEAYLESIDGSRKLTKDPYPWREKRRWLARIGFEMQLLRATEQKKENKIKDKDLLVTRTQVLDWIQQAMEHSGYPRDLVFAGDYLNWIARRSGLLLPRGENLFAFLHLSFQEYFAALYIGELLTDPDWVIAQRDNSSYIEGDNRITARDLKVWANDARWQETLVFCFEGFAHSPKEARRLAEWIFGKNFSMCFKHEYFDEDSDDNFYKKLLARILVDPHSGLSPKEKDFAFLAITNSFLYPISESDEDHPQQLDEYKFVETDELLVLLSSETWQDKVWEKAVATNVVKLDIRQQINSILERIHHWQHLRDVSLRDATESNVVALANLTKIDTLSLYFPQMTHFSEVACFKNLKSLSLQTRNFGEFDLIGRLPKLKTLYLLNAALFHFKIPDYLNTLNLYYCSFSDYNVLSTLTNIQGLSLFGTKISDIKPLANLRNLHSLDLRKTNVRDLSPLKNLTNLKYLDISDTQISDVSVLAHISELNIIRVRNTAKERSKRISR